SPDDPSLVHDFQVVLFEDANPSAVQSALITLGIHDIQVLDDREIGGSLVIYFVLDDLGRIPEVAKIEDIIWIEPVIPPTNASEAAGIMQSGSATNMSIWNRGLHGEGQVVDVTDDGWPGLNHCFFEDKSPNNPGLNHRKLIDFRGTSILGP